jgi:hypothetical protein
VLDAIDVLLEACKVFDDGEDDWSGLDRLGLSADPSGEYPEGSQSTPGTMVIYDTIGIGEAVAFVPTRLLSLSSCSTLDSQW